MQNKAFLVASNGEKILVESTVKIPDETMLAWKPKAQGWAYAAYPQKSPFEILPIGIALAVLAFILYLLFQK